MASKILSIFPKISKYTFKDKLFYHVQQHILSSSIKLNARNEIEIMLEH